MTSDAADGSSQLRIGPAAQRALVLVDHLARHRVGVRIDELAAEVACGPPAAPWVAPVALIAGLRSEAVAARARRVAAACGEDEIGSDATAVHAVAAIARHGGQPMDVDRLVALLGAHARTAASRQALQIVRALSTSATAGPPLAAFFGIPQPVVPVVAALTGFLRSTDPTCDTANSYRRGSDLDLADILGAALRGAFLGEAAAAPWAHRLESSFDIFTATGRLLDIGANLDTGTSTEMRGVATSSPRRWMA